MRYKVLKNHNHGNKLYQPGDVIDTSDDLSVLCTAGADPKLELIQDAPPAQKAAPLSDLPDAPPASPHGSWSTAR